MLHFILNKIFPPMPALTLSAPPPFSEAAMESARDSARELTNSGPTFSEHDWDAVIAAVGRALEEPAIAEPTRGRGRPRKYSFYDLDVGQSCRMPMSAGTSNIHAHARATGKLFTTRAKANGRWIKRVA